jgi:hypothetical protein
MRPDSVDDAMAGVIAASQLDLPTNARTLQQYVRHQCRELYEALAALVDAIPEQHLAAITSTWQFAQLHASMWQLVAYVRGQPIALDYVDSTFLAAARRAAALADVVDELVPPEPLAEPTLISDIILTDPNVLRAEQ